MLQYVEACVLKHCIPFLRQVKRKILQGIIYAWSSFKTDVRRNKELGCFFFKYLSPFGASLTQQSTGFLHYQCIHYFFVLNLDGW